MSTDEASHEKRAFKVEDRRRFSESGEPRAEQGEAETTAAPSPEGAAPKGVPGESDRPAMEINFSTFLLSLSTQALAHLGEIPNPVSEKVEIDLGSAKQLIDILGMLKEKTKGNLDNVENGLLENVLYDLRLRYVERARTSQRS
jgi:hypothetical protein